MSPTYLPETLYARSGELSIAYQVIGNGPIDLIFVPGAISHVEFLHELPGYTNFLRRIASFARVITFDKSGQGLSDRYLGMPSFEQRVDVVRAVMDATASRRAVLLGCSEGGPISIVFAATYPERVSHLILFGSFARFTAAPDYPFRRSEDEIMRYADDAWVPNWGAGISMRYFLPSYAGNPDVAQQYTKLETLGLRPWRAQDDVSLQQRDRCTSSSSCDPRADVGAASSGGIRWPQKMLGFWLLTLQQPSTSNTQIVEII